MALIQTYLPFDIENTNFYRTNSPSPDYYFLQNNTRVLFQDGGMQSQGYSFDDSLSFLYSYAGDSYLYSAGGNNLTWNGSSLTGGTLVALRESIIYTGGSTEVAYEVQDFAVPATSFSAARLTASTTDDYSLIESVLSGNDSIIGSSYTDIFRGYGGSDSINGAGGTDTAIYSGKFSEYNFSLNKATKAAELLDDS